MTGALYSLGRFCARRRFLVLGAWAVLIASVGAFAISAGSDTTNNVELPGTGSQNASDLLSSRFPSQANGSNPIVISTNSGKLTESKYASAIDAATKSLEKTPHVNSAVSPLSEQGAPALSKDERIGYISVYLDVGAGDITVDEADAIIAAADPAKQAGLAVSAGGYLGQEVSQPSTGASTAIGLFAAVIVLVLAFGSVVAMGLPIGTAVIGLLLGLSLVTLLSHVVNVPTNAPTLATMIGLAVGIDYSLFVVTKHRTQVAKGMEVHESIARAVATAGGAVLFAGGTVAVSLISLAVADIPIVTELGFSAAVAVLTAILAALTLLPALFGVLGGHISSLQLFGRRRGGHASTWTRLATWLTAHPWPVIVAVLAGLLVLAVPTLDLRLGQADVGALPKDTTSRQAYDEITEGFGEGTNGPFLISAELSTPANPADPESDAGLVRLQQALAKTKGVQAVGAPLVNSTGDAAVLTLIPTTAPADFATEDLVDRLRDDTIPEATVGQGVTAYVGGTTAAFVDLATKIGDKLILVILVVAALSFFVLLLGFRSLLLPAQAAIMNLVSVAAAYGVLTAIFQKGWGAGLIGLDTSIPVVSFVPLIMFAVLFGLSTDYQVFLLTQIQEHFKEGKGARQTVVEGLTYSGRIILSAAAVMFSVFAAFAISGDPTVKQFGVGLAAAVAIDALVVCLFVPALLMLFGRATLWLPGWLDRILPNISIEGDRYFAERDRVNS